MIYPLLPIAGGPNSGEAPEREKAVNALKSAREGNQARFNGYCKTAKGKDKYWDVMVSPIMDTDGQPRRILSIARDMTVRRDRGGPVPGNREAGKPRRAGGWHRS